jgi:hypothetical protein
MVNFQKTKEGQKIKKHIEKTYCLTVKGLKKLSDDTYIFKNNKELFFFNKKENRVF